MKKIIIALVITLMMVISGFAVLMTYTPPVNNGKNLNAQSDTVTPVPFDASKYGIYHYYTGSGNIPYNNYSTLHFVGSTTNPIQVQYNSNSINVKAVDNGTTNLPESYLDYTFNVSVLRHTFPDYLNTSYSLGGGTSFSYAGVGTKTVWKYNRNTLLTILTYSTSRPTSVLVFNGTSYSANFALPTVHMNFTSDGDLTLYSFATGSNGAYTYKHTFAGITTGALTIDSTDVNYTGPSTGENDEYQGWSANIPFVNPVKITVNSLKPGNLTAVFNDTNNAFTTNYTVNTTLDLHFNASYFYSQLGIVNNVTVTLSTSSGVVAGSPFVLNVSKKMNYDLNGFTVSCTTRYILFDETGLPYGQSWNVSLTNKTANVVNATYASTTNTTKALLPPGYNYSFSFSTFDASYYKIVNLTGIVYLSPNANATVNITLTNVSYDVVFHESGPLSGNAWGIKFNGTDYNTTSASLTLIEKNGSYPFTVLIPDLYDSNVSSGYANVSGKSLNLYIGFTYHAFNITFSEVGLPSNVQWSMTINGTVYYSNVSDSNILLFQSKMGSYTGIVNNASFYTPVSKYFNFTITGNAQYTIDYGITLTFIETGYTGLWHVTVDGQTYSSSTNTIVAKVSPGQVVFNVWGVSGYTINPEVVTQTYTSAQTIKIAFTVQPPSFENVLISTPMVILYFVLAIMAMAGVVYWRLKHER